MGKGARGKVIRGNSAKEYKKTRAPSNGKEKGGIVESGRVLGSWPPFPPANKNKVRKEGGKRGATQVRRETGEKKKAAGRSERRASEVQQVNGRGVESKRGYAATMETLSPETFQRKKKKKRTRWEGNFNRRQKGKLGGSPEGRERGKGELYQNKNLMGKKESGDKSAPNPKEVGVEKSALVGLPLGLVKKQRKSKK